MTRSTRITRTEWQDPIEHALHQSNRRLVFIALTVLVVVFAVAIMISDLFLRSDSFHGHGTDPRSWDAIGSLLLIAWTWAALSLWFRKR